ncbi:MAG: M48 family metallopeptidase [Zoogloeaceae bacterium]|jgi:predicted Zn-dependent protease|nr:M48 family metallopeptidase [Zoogloeaceae bacterium]
MSLKKLALLLCALLLPTLSGCIPLETRPPAANEAPSQNETETSPEKPPQPQATEEDEGITVGEMSAIRGLISAKELENQANADYQKLLRNARSENTLIPTDAPQAQRLNIIAQRIIPFSKRFNPNSSEWKWEINLIESKDINAFCMPGGKIAFYTGLIDTLKATDDELAIVMGHEMAHALREHSRAQIAKSRATSLGASLLGILVGGGKYANIFDFTGNMLNLKFSRDDENEADLVGLDLAARAGYDPRAGISLWEKMDAARESPFSLTWISTHPSNSDRIKNIEAQLPKVMPIYEKTQATPAARKPAAENKKRVNPRKPATTTPKKKITPPDVQSLGADLKERDSSA